MTRNPVEPRADARRILGRVGRRDRGGPRRRRDRQRHRRLDPHAGALLRRLRPQADATGSSPDAVTSRDRPARSASTTSASWDRSGEAPTTWRSLLDVLAGPDGDRRERLAPHAAAAAPALAPRLSRRRLARRPVQPGRRRGAGARDGDGRGAPRGGRHGRRDGAAGRRSRRRPPLLREAPLADPLGRHEPRRTSRSSRRSRTASPPDSTNLYDRFTRAVTLKHRDWLAVDEERQHLRRGWAEFFERFDVLICPVQPLPAIPHDHEETHPQPRPFG